MLNLKSIKEQLAIVILSYADYESLEIALAVHSKFFPHLTGSGGGKELSYLYYKMDTAPMIASEL